jgi:hypothetical protein
MKLVTEAGVKVQEYSLTASEYLALSDEARFELLERWRAARSAPKVKGTKKSPAAKINSPSPTITDEDVAF